jgi:HEAT repeat protein
VDRKEGKVFPAEDSSLRQWEVGTGKELQRIVGFPTGIGAAAFSPDGQYAAVSGAGVLKEGAWQQGADLDIHLWDLKLRKEVRTLSGHTKEIFSLAFSADGKQLLSGGPDQVVRLWDVASGRLLKQMLGHTNSINQVVFSPDGKRALSAGSDLTARLWDLQTGNEIRQGPEHKDIVWAVAFSPDGRQAVSAGGMQSIPGVGFVAGARDHDIRLWNVETGRELKRFKGHPEAVGALAFSPDGRRLLSAGNDGTIRLWQVESGREVRNLRGHTGLIRGLAFFPDRRRGLSGGDDKTLRLWPLPGDIPDLIKDLRTSDAGVRLEAVAELARSGEDARPAFPALLEALASGTPDFRDKVLLVLKKMGTPGKEHVATLMTLVRDRKFPAGRVYALDSLAALGADARPAASALVDALSDANATVRAQAIKILGGIGPSVRDLALGSLVAALRDRDASVSAAAVDALDKLGEPAKADVPDLRKHLKDEMAAVRRYALNALGKLGPSATAAFDDLVERITADRDPALRAQAIATVLEVEPNRKEALTAYTRALADTNAMVYRQAVRALVQVSPDAGALPGLFVGLGHKDATVSKAANEALGKVRFTKEHVNTLAEALKSRQPVVRTRALTVVARLGPDGAGAVASLCGLLKGKQSAKERMQVIETLGKIGPGAREAGPHLVELLKDKDQDLRLETSLVLAKIRAEEVDRALPILIKALKADKLEDLEDEDAKADRERVKKALVQLGKPAVKALADALEGTFAGGNPRTPAGFLKGAARLEVIGVLLEMGKPAGTNSVLLSLAHLERSDPFPAIKKAARAARVKLQK